MFVVFESIKFVCMRRLFIILFSLITVSVVNAQGVNFESENFTMKQAIAKAKTENKLIFVDCYTQWCGPCQRMSQEVFSQRKVGEIMNSNFVNLKIDMESLYGISFATRWKVEAYPTFIIFNNHGEEIDRFMGWKSADEFIKCVKRKKLTNKSNSSKAPKGNTEYGEISLKKLLQLGL